MKNLKPRKNKIERRLIMNKFLEGIYHYFQKSTDAKDFEKILKIVIWFWFALC